MHVDRSFPLWHENEAQNLVIVKLRSSMLSRFIFIVICNLESFSENGKDRKSSVGEEDGAEYTVHYSSYFNTSRQQDVVISSNRSRVFCSSSSFLYQIRWTHEHVVMSGMAELASAKKRIKDMVFLFEIFEYQQVKTDSKVKGKIKQVGTNTPNKINNPQRPPKAAYSISPLS